MTLKSTRIYRIMGTKFSGKMARPRQMIGRDTPPPPRGGLIETGFNRAFTASYTFQVLELLNFSRSEGRVSSKQLMIQNTCGSLVARPAGEGEGEVEVSSAKRWDRRNS